MSPSRRILLLSILTTGFLGTVAAEPPVLNVSPGTVDLTGNQSIPANQNHTVELNFTNQDAQRPIYNVTLPDKDYLFYSDNRFNLNGSQTRQIKATINTPSPTTISDQFTYSKENDSERDPIRYYYNQTSGNNTGITYDAESFPIIEFNIRSYWENTSISTMSLDSDFNLSFEQTDDSVFKIQNDGEANAYNIELDGEDIKFDHNTEFNLTAGDDVFIPFTVQLPKPDSNATEATNQTYTRSIQVRGENFETSTLTLEIFVPYKQYDQEAVEDNITQRWLELQEKTIQICQRDQFEDSPLCGGNIVEYRNNTEFVNRTPVYTTNLTSEEREALRTVNLTGDRIQNLQDRYDLLKHSLNTDVEQMNETMVAMLEQAINNSQEAKEMAREAKQADEEVKQAQQAQRKNMGQQAIMAILVIIVFGSLIGGGFTLYKIYQKQHDYRITQR